MTFTHPQLSDEKNDVANLALYCHGPEWPLSQKADGDRRLVVVEGADVQAFTRDGKPTSLPTDVAREFGRIGGTFTFDGELIGGALWLFDMPIAGALVSPTTPFGRNEAGPTRRQALEAMHSNWDPAPCVRLLPLAWTLEEKVRLAGMILRSGAEGLIANHVDAPYQPGRRNHLQRKLKFTKTADCVVTDVCRDGKANMVLSCYDASGTLVEVGEATQLAGTGVAAAEQFRRWQAGDVAARPVVEVTYLYALRENRRLVQPTLPVLRTDKQPEECSIEQLQFVSKEVIADIPVDATA